jgi:crotonobetainyl-CoA:carnitine CoA-transferase CaiB-like acyl-CoA transferase
MSGLLEGVRVLDLTIWRPGPYATQLLAEIGADVIKVEPPGGDPMRLYPGLFLSLSANKRSIVLDLKSDAGRAEALGLAAGAEVVIEGFRPGVVDRLGVGYEAVRAVNPSVVYCSLSGLGQTGDLALVPGHDLNYSAWAGALTPEGGEARVPAIPVADLAGGMTAAFAVCAALVRRGRAGEGEQIDVAMTDVLATWTGAVAPEGRDLDPDARGVPGYGVFACADGAIALGVLSEDHFWGALCRALGLDDHAGLSFVDRVVACATLQAALAAAIATRARDDLVADLMAVDVPVSPVLDRRGMLGVAHFRQRGVVTADPWADPASGYPVRFVVHPAARTSPPPTLDEHRGAHW